MKLFVCSLLLLAVFNGFLYDRLGSMGASVSGPELVALIKNGTRVVRGRDWEWDDQDGGPGGIGSVVGEIRKDKWVRVRWDVGGRNLYRMGLHDKYDLKLASDFSTTEKTTTRPTFGKNNRSPIEPVAVKYIKPGTRVVRGRDWQSGDQDGGPGSEGTLIAVGGDGWVTVMWDTGEDRMYRMGSDGSYDVMPAPTTTTTPIPTSTSSTPPLFSLHESYDTENPDIASVSGRMPVGLMKIGTRVVRGRDWKWLDQDGGPGSEGTILGKISRWGLVTVLWDNGVYGAYRMGAADKYDLKLAPTRDVSPPTTTTQETPKSGSELALRKNGTRVIRIGEADTCWDEDVKPGTLGTVDSVPTDWECVHVSWDDGQKIWYCSDTFEACVQLAPIKVTTPQIAATETDYESSSEQALKKNGTRVVWIGKAYPCWDLGVTPGTLGTVESIGDRDCVSVNWDDGHKRWYCKHGYEACVQLAPTDSTTTQISVTETDYHSSDTHRDEYTSVSPVRSSMSDTELAALKKNGTRVIRNEDGSCWDNVRLNSLGTVVSFDDNWNCVHVRWDIGIAFYYCAGSYDECLKLAPTDSTPTVSTPLSGTKTVYSSGDVQDDIYTSTTSSQEPSLWEIGARVVRIMGIGDTCWIEDIEPGTLGTVVSIRDRGRWDCVQVSWDDGNKEWYCKTSFEACVQLAPTATSTMAPATTITVTETVTGSEDQWASASSTQASLSGPELAALMVRGTRVVRGKDWMSDDTDGGPGNVGTIIYVLDQYSCVGVKWDNGNIYWYRMGNYGHYDLKLAPTSKATTFKSSSVSETVSYSEADVLSTTVLPTTSSGSKLAPFMVRGTKVVRASDWGSSDQGVVGTVLHDLDQYDCVTVEWSIGIHWYCGTYEDMLRLAPTNSTNSTTTSKPTANETDRCMDNYGEDVYITESPWMVKGFELLKLVKNGTRIIRQSKNARSDYQDWRAGTILYDRDDYSWNLYYPSGNYSCYYLKPASTLAEPITSSATTSLETSTPLSVTETVRHSDEGATLSGPELAKLMKIGTRVVRGKDWDFWGYFEHDGGEGGEGTVIRGLSELNWLAVRWDRTGRAFTYRMGFEDKYDLQLAPKSTTTTWQPTLTTERVKSNKDYRRHKPRKYNKA